MTANSVPYRDSNLFSDYYLDECVDVLQEWDDDTEVEVTFRWLREFWELASKRVDSYDEDGMPSQEISEVFSVLSTRTISEAMFLNGGCVDRYPYNSDENRRVAVEYRTASDTAGMFSQAPITYEANRATLKEQSLVPSYRLPFILYAESHGLIDKEIQIDEEAGKDD